MRPFLVDQLFEQILFSGWLFALQSNQTPEKSREGFTLHHDARNELLVGQLSAIVQVSNGRH